MTTNPSSQQPARSESGAPRSGLTQAQRAQVQRCFERGRQVLLQDKPDREYAHTMFLECVRRDPGNVVYVEALVQNLHAKYGNNGKGARFRWASRGGLKRALHEENWPEVLTSGWELLRSNPWDMVALRALAQAAAAQQHYEVELWYLKAALNSQPKDLEINRHCGRSLARLGQFDQSVACWRRVLDQQPHDDEALRMISELTVAKTIRPAGATATSTKAGVGATSAMADGALRPREAGDKKTGRVQVPRRSADLSETPLDGTPAVMDDEPVSLLEQLTEEFTADPAETTSALKLARLLVEDRQFSQAENVLSQCLAAGGNNLKVLEELEETRLAAARARLEVAQQRAGLQRSPEAVELLADLTAEFNRLEIDLLYERCERYPQETRWQLQLGQALKRAGNFAQALKCFQRVSVDPEYSLQGGLETGECLQFMKQFQRALQAYRTALTGSDGEGEQPELRWLVGYRAAVLAEALGDLTAARELLSPLAELSPPYRDVPARLQKLSSPTTPPA